MVLSLCVCNGGAVIVCVMVVLSLCVCNGGAVIVCAVIVCGAVIVCV